MRKRKPKYQYGKNMVAPSESTNLGVKYFDPKAIADLEYLQNLKRNQQTISQARFQDDYTKTVNNQKRANQVKSLPNAQLVGNQILPKNPDRKLSGEALPNTRAAKNDKALEHAQGAMDAAGLLMGVGALRPLLSEGLERLGARMFRPRFSTAVDDLGMHTIDSKTGKQVYQLTDEEMITPDYEPHFTADDYKKYLKNDELSKQSREILNEVGLPNDGGFSSMNNPTYNKMRDLLQYGKQPTPKSIDFITSEELVNDNIFKREFLNNIKNLDKINPGVDNWHDAMTKTMESLKNNPDFNMDIGLKRSIQRLSKGPDAYNPYSKNYQPEFLLSEHPLKSQAIRALRHPEIGMFDNNFSVIDKKLDVLGDNISLGKQTNLQNSMINFRPEFAPNRSWSSKAMEMYRKQVPEALKEMNLEKYSGVDAFKKLIPNKKGGLIKAQLGLNGVTLQGVNRDENDMTWKQINPITQTPQIIAPTPAPVQAVVDDPWGYNTIGIPKSIMDRFNPNNPIQKGRTAIGQPITKSPVEEKEQKDSFNPYFMLRGATTGLSWLANKREQNRQNQYMYDQYSTLGQMQPLNVEDFQPNPFSLYARFGGSLKKGGIHINPNNKGKFTASAKRAGMGVQEFASHVLANKEKYSPTQVKRANFARNASKFKH